jgi:peptidoglycan/LPS O-acetylase OafA/YrhL
MIYGVGVIFVCLGILTYICDYKKHNNFILNSLAFAGRFSFSIFIYHHVGILLFPNTFNVIWIWPTVIGYTISFIFLIWIIVKKFNAIGLIEWMMVIITYDIRDNKSEKGKPAR